MKPDSKLFSHFLFLSGLFVLFFIPGSLLIPDLISGITKTQFLITLLYFFLFTLLLFVLFYRGLTKDPRKGILYTFGAIALKLLAHMVYILVFYLLTKNLTMDFIIVFFVLYLAFTLYLILTFIKELKSKQL
ncbi:MAG: hypothetical protein U9N53_00275 [Bacteroidota bacterium]|nr:hypothetical protein [Bacteroidota bacterium]